MSRKIGLSILALLVAFCIGLSLIAMAGAVIIVQQSQSVPAQVIPAP
jgi:hypothetical protein